MTWIRELAGWLLILLGLGVFGLCLVVLLTDGPWLLESIFLSFIGFLVFRGGILLLRVGLSARICLNAREADASLRLRHGRNGESPADTGRAFLL